MAASIISHTRHAFWPDDLSICDPGALDVHQIAGSAQLTDAYLVALAARHGGRLVTFDRRLSERATHLPGVAIQRLPG